MNKIDLLLFYTKQLQEESVRKSRHRQRCEELVNDGLVSTAWRALDIADREIGKPRSNAWFDRQLILIRETAQDLRDNIA